jgi:hypothetical protein
VRKSRILKTAALFAMIISSEAYAGLAIQTLYGLGYGRVVQSADGDQIVDDNLNVSRSIVEAHIDPFVNVPLTFAFFGSSMSAESDVPMRDIDTMKGYEFGWNVLTWTYLRGFGFSFRYGQTLAGEADLKILNADGFYENQTYSISNSFAGLGLATPVSSAFGVILEYRHIIETKFKALSQISSQGYIPENLDGGMVLLGLEFSL